MKWNREIDRNNNRQHFSGKTPAGEYKELLAPVYVGDDRYELYDILSEAGGFGIIYRAKDTRLNNHEVLIKSRRYDNEPGLFSFQYDNTRESKIEKIREKTLFEAECLKMFKQNRESRMPILNDVVEGFSPTIYGPHKDSSGENYYIEDEYIYYEPYIVMQVVEGVNLGDYIKNGIEFIVKKRNYRSYFEWERTVLEYAKELATIFIEFHRPRQEGNNSFYYVYQDLKPDNIILSNDRFITLLDFGGITKIKIKERKNQNGEAETYTETSIGSPGLGTFGFQAPEARNSAMIKNLDHRCDIYTLGATIYQLLTGFDFADILETEDTEIPLEKSLKGVCSEATYSFLQKCLQRDREKRFSSMQELRTEILMNCFESVKAEIRRYY